MAILFFEQPGDCGGGIGATAWQKRYVIRRASWDGDGVVGRLLQCLGSRVEVAFSG